jgi:isoleucyl-tRNA synthetase
MSGTSTKYKELKQLDLPAIEKEMLAFWSEQNIFDQSITSREGQEEYVFYEGPPSANGMPGIHHVISRTIKDLFCRYKTLKGYQVKRKGGWDTHGLPVELQVEKELGIVKDDIGTKITIADYNQKCRETVMKFKSEWDDLTQKMGYWVDLDNPYVTFENEYIETLWWLLRQLYDKGLLYKGYTIQPFSPAAGTGLSSHELNLPGSYRNIKDTTVVAQFLVKETEASKDLLASRTTDAPVYFLAWTTTPWTLSSNAALAVGKNIDYVLARVKHGKSEKEQFIVCAKVLLESLAKDGELLEEVQTFKGADLEGIEYEQLLPYVTPDKPAFRVILGDFVTTEDGTGIVHIAPTFGGDDFRVAQQNDIPSILVEDALGNPTPLVTRQGKFVDEVTDLAGRYVRAEYEDPDLVGSPDYKSADIEIIIRLFNEDKAWSKAKYEHSYPHCWRTDKPVIYYPLDSWFIKTTAVKEKLIERNRTINWKPESTGTGRFEAWLENLVDWNLSRSRFWGTPLPIWRTEEGDEEICIGSMEELREEVRKSIEAGHMEKELGHDIDLHRPYVDDIILVSPSGKAMKRESDLIDVWFDSGAMPYAQWHYPFENKEIFDKSFPADFIAEGVDQTRGWFFTLHAIANMVSDSVAYKNVVSNGLVLDKEGNKMSKRVGNVVNPFETIDKYGADASRWYMMSNAQPWDNLKFDIGGIEEVQRKFFGTLYNTYAFFVLYANIDGFDYTDADVPINERPEIDRWIISQLNSLIKEVDAFYEDYEPTRAARAIQSFVDQHLSNWYVRLCRRRFWKGEMNQDKISAYQTLYTCLEVLAQLMSPVSPFFSEYLYQNLNGVTNKLEASSVHLSNFPSANESAIDKDLEERMGLAQDASSIVLALRKKVMIKVRQPLQKILIPVLDSRVGDQIRKVEDLILSEVNVKEVEYVDDASGVVSKTIKPNFKMLGKKWGPKMKELAAAISQWGPNEIRAMETNGKHAFDLGGEVVEVLLEEVEILSADVEGWLADSIGNLTVALDVTISEELKEEGNARELVNRVQKIRKDKGLEVTDRIHLKVVGNELLEGAFVNYKDYICREILATELEIVESLAEGTELNINDSVVVVDVIKSEENAN